jgi:WD40 repeat protein
MQRPYVPWAPSVAFGNTSNDKLLLASACERSVLLWDPATGSSKGELTGHEENVTSLAFATAPDGRLLLASGSDDHTVRTWDPTNGTGLDRLTGHTDKVTSLAFTETTQGRLLLISGGEDRTVRIWDAMVSAPLGVFRRRASISSIAANGLTIAICDNDGVSVIELDRSVVE